LYGTLCAIDPAPRRISSDAVIGALRECAARVAAILNGKRG
jgi:hypothetical protein